MNNNQTHRVSLVGEMTFRDTQWKDDARKYKATRDSLIDYLTRDNGGNEILKNLLEPRTHASPGFSVYHVAGCSVALREQLFWRTARMEVELYSSQRPDMSFITGIENATDFFLHYTRPGEE